MASGESISSVFRQLFWTQLRAVTFVGSPASLPHNALLNGLVLGTLLAICYLSAEEGLAAIHSTMALQQEYSQVFANVADYQLVTVLLIAKVAGYASMIGLFYALFRAHRRPERFTQSLLAVSVVLVLTETIDTLGGSFIIVGFINAIAAASILYAAFGIGVIRALVLSALLDASRLFITLMTIALGLVEIIT